MGTSAPAEGAAVAGATAGIVGSDAPMMFVVVLRLGSVVPTAVVVTCVAVPDALGPSAVTTRDHPSQQVEAVVLHVRKRDPVLFPDGPQLALQQLA